MTPAESLTARIMERSSEKKLTLNLVKPKAKEVIKLLMPKRVETKIIFGYRKAKENHLKIHVPKRLKQKNAKVEQVSSALWQSDPWNCPQLPPATTTSVLPSWER